MISQNPEMVKQAMDMMQKMPECERRKMMEQLQKFMENQDSSGAMKYTMMMCRWLSNVKTSIGFMSMHRDPRQHIYALKTMVEQAPGQGGCGCGCGIIAMIQRSLRF